MIVRVRTYVFIKVFMIFQKTIILLFITCACFMRTVVKHYDYLAAQYHANALIAKRLEGIVSSTSAHELKLMSVHFSPISCELELMPVEVAY